MIMSSDVLSDVSDDENRFARKSRPSFEKMAAKGWSTCAEGFDKSKETSQSESKLYSEKWTSLGISNNVLRTIQRKKKMKKVYHKYSGILDHRFNQFWKENIDVDPDFLSENTSKRYKPSVIHYRIEDSRELQIAPRMEKLTKWTYSNLSDTFCEASDVTESPLNTSTRRKRPPRNDRMKIDVRIDSVPSSEEIVIDKGSSDLNSLQNGLSDEIVTCSPSPQSLQEMTDLRKFIRCNMENPKLPAVATRTLPVQNCQNSIDHSIVRSIDDSDAAKAFQKGSDWLKGIAWHNSSAMDNSHADCDEEKAHSIRPQKFFPGGLAERAAKLEKKIRHSRLVWSHQRKGKAASFSERCLTVQLCSFDVMNGMVLSKCIALKKPTPVTNKSVVITTSPSNAALSGQDSVNQDAECQHSVAKNDIPIGDMSINDGKASALSHEHYFLLLKPSTVKELKLTAGSVIRLYPPWQNLDVSSLPHPVILCSYYIEVLDSYEPSENSTAQGAMEDIIFQSNDHDKNNDSDLCPPSHKLSKQRKRLNAVSQTKDIRKFFKEPPKDATAKLDPSNNCDSNSSQCLKSSCPGAILPSHSGDQSFLASFCISGAMFSLCARVQRIWQCPSTDFKLRQKYSAYISPLTSNTRHSLVLQDKHFQCFVIHLLNVSSSPNSLWSDLLKQGEGKCFQFSAIKVTQILQPSKFPALFAMLKHIKDKQMQEMPLQDQAIYQPFCYQLAVDCSRSFVVDLPNSSCPPYCSYEVLSLDKMTENDTVSRFSCCVKLLCEVDDVLYITDKSLQKKHAPCSYVKMHFWSRKVKPSISSGSNILVAEAVVQKGGLYVDKYSSVTLLPQERKDRKGGFFASNPASKELVEELDSFSLSNCTWTKLQPASRVGDLVTVKGIVCNVDEDTAVSWLECNVCGKENLYQDAEYKILCSLCNCVVKVPKLSMKMHVSVQVIEMLEAAVIVELSCLTTKKILEIPDNVCQPKCNITDVLHKKIGPLVCLVQSHQDLNNKLRLKLQEIVLS